MDRYWRSLPPIWSIHTAAVRARSPVCTMVCPTPTATSSGSLPATTGALGVWDSLGPVSQSLHPASSATGSRARKTSLRCLCISVVLSRSKLAVQAHGHDDGAGLRIVEVIDPLDEGRRTREARLGIDPAILGPRVQVAPRDPEVHAAEAVVGEPRLRQRVGQRDLAQLGVAAVLDELRGDGAEAAAQSLEPGLVQGHGHADAGTAHGAGHPLLAELHHLAAILRVDVLAEVVQSTARAVPHLSAVLDVHERGERHLVEGGRRADAPGPLLIGIRDHAVGGVEDRVAVGVEEQRALGRVAAELIDVLTTDVQSEPAAREVVAADHADGGSRPRRGDGAFEAAAAAGREVHELLAGQADHLVLVPGPLHADLPVQVDRK